MEGSLASTLAGPGLNDGVRTPPLGLGGARRGLVPPSVLGFHRKRTKRNVGGRHLKVPGSNPRFGGRRAN